MIWLNDADVASLLSVEDALPLVEAAFAATARGEAQMPPKTYLTFPEHGGDLRAMPASLPKLPGLERAYAGVKVVNSHPGNPARGLPTVMATLVLNDPETGAPLAVMSAGRLTDLRTGAAGGVAAKYLSRADAATLGLVGCGRQAITQWMAVAAVRPIREVLVAGATREEAEAFCGRQAPFAARLDRTGAGPSAGRPRFRAVPVDEAAGADVVVTTTPGRSPVVRAEWLRPGAHVNAIGADAPGKQELETAALRKTRVFVDHPAQAFHSGEVNVPLSTGSLAETDIAGSLGDVIVGKTPGRRSPEEITLFDSTGLAVQDVSVAGWVFQQARARGIGQLLTM
jgi:alanine dehydrogenase